MSDCIFCKIVEGQLPSFTIYQDGHFLVILDRYPTAIGHVLIIPKRHVADIYSLNNEEAAALMPLAQKVASKMNDYLEMDGLNLLQSNGEAAGQIINHFHLHLIPRYKNDSITINGPQTGQSAKELEQIAKQLNIPM